MSTDKLKIGVIGCGTVAKVGHLPVYHKSPLTEIVAVSDPLESHLKYAQEHYNVSKGYKNSEDLLLNLDLPSPPSSSPLLPKTFPHRRNNGSLAI